ncbi:MAG: efflux RND transporter periplasmic adaptor subunit [Anaerolineae bacterium]|nr:efflux RND transporter periplasmic adaptor subunit [Anaerolineae bacterium]
MKRIIPIIIILAALGAGYWWYTNSQPIAAALEPTAEPPLVGSGSIEAETVAITAELGGRILELLADEGDEVTAGQILIELDKSDLLAQQLQLEATLSTAKANLESVAAPARPEDIAVAQAQLKQAGVTRDGLKIVWETVAKLANDPLELEAQINLAQARVTEAEKGLEMAQVNLKRAEIQAEAAGRNQSDHIALVQNDVAQYQLQAAQIGIKIAEVSLTGAKQQVEHLIRMRDEPLFLITQTNAAEAAYKQAEAAVQAAQANLTAVEADPTPEDIAVAKAQVREAETAMAAVQVQLDKQILTAPRDGLISQKLVNPGELAAPGAILMELSDIDTVDLTVYIPETRIGQVHIGQEAVVYVDAYPGETFKGQVSFIAHEAEFTPRNVQTQEERVNLVFAVKITLNNPDHLLKPGMPADAEIGRN